ncbi:MULTISPECIES: NADPH-dependent F420 reductase [Protofrankia]|uniref:NADP oxidoreductase coenzyme F420-dependent n=1 Tax=Candidatus Protofrankia datiscae TaxID=2716812 RepID=F8AV50_9ACTN|nr:MULTISPECIES: NAD(P)-binding domain-containing protein [Protofrankia]AEH10570.1 NADP oxidoreductase coenzyme F420-dependent [Candidatus Protofrankia datiscae]
MRIGILGTGALAEGLGRGWAHAGHELVIGGRSRAKADALAERLGGAARAASPREVVTGRDAVLLAVLWAGVEDVLRSVDAADGRLAGTPLIDPTNAVEHGVGVLLTEHGRSAAGRIAELAPGAHVVKALHLFPAEQWTRPPTNGVTGTDGVTEGDSDGKQATTVAICGDDAAALRVTSELVRDVGGIPAVLGPLDRARQLEEVAGFVIGLAFAGFDPASAVPHVPTRTIPA